MFPQATIVQPSSLPEFENEQIQVPVHPATLEMVKQMMSDGYEHYGGFTQELKTDIANEFKFDNFEVEAVFLQGSILQASSTYPTSQTHFLSLRRAFRCWR